MNTRLQKEEKVTLLKTIKYEGIWLNPKLPQNFSNTPNEERSPAQLKKWWNTPFIVVTKYSKMDKNYEAFKKRMSQYDMTIESENEYNTRIEAQRAAWFGAWTDGLRFAVRCLDGGAWDRPTCLGMFGTFGEAFDLAKKIKEEN